VNPRRISIEVPFDENIAAPIDKLAWLWANAAQRDHAALQL